MGIERQPIDFFVLKCDRCGDPLSEDDGNRTYRSSALVLESEAKKKDWKTNEKQHPDTKWICPHCQWLLTREFLFS
jgi:hypothetical protein